jgi:hypothetical protein
VRVQGAYLRVGGWFLRLLVALDRG